MRIVLRIGGSVVASPVNTNLISKYVEIVRILKGQGHEVAIVVGGGDLAREFIDIAKKLGLSEQLQDEVAISVSRLYAQLFLKTLSGTSCGKVAMTLNEAANCLNKYKILVMGGLKPGMTTDSVAALIAEYSKADLLIKGTNQDGVYTKDPQKHADAIKLDRLSFDELSEIFSDSKHKAGIHQIIDPEAVKIMKRDHLKVIVVNGFKPENVLAAVNGESVGTVIH